jgi:CheY-like chemotaxis protein
MPTSAEQSSSQSRQRRVFVVEDEIMIRMLLEDMLADLGYGVAASAGGVDEAVALAREGDFDLAILDVNLNGAAVYPVAEVLVQRKIPFIFSTGYGERGLSETYRDRPTLQKPFQLDTLDRMLARMAEDGGQRTETGSPSTI